MTDANLDAWAVRYDAWMSRTFKPRHLAIRAGFAAVIAVVFLAAPALALAGVLAASMIWELTR